MNTQNPVPKVIVGQQPLTIDDCVNVAKKMYLVEIHPDAIKRIQAAREFVEKQVKENRIIYGLTTGFGSLSTTCIDSKDTVKLQENLIRSHAVGCGDPAPNFIVRSMLLIRLACITNGNSGVRLAVAQKLVEALNKNYIPEVPSKGTVGASGDLAPLSHLILGLMGEGNAYDADTKSYVDASIVMKKLNIEPIILMEKEGLALNNGTQFITSYAVFDFDDAIRVFHKSNMVASMTIEAIHGTHKAFDSLISDVKPHEGQQFVAAAIRSYILQDSEPSEINKKYAENKVQDAYDIRCIPQVAGPVYDLLMFSKKIIETEMNSSNDNPLIFADLNKILSGGNFHGMYIGMVCDFIAYGMSVLCNISERRTDRLMNPALNKFLPEFLVENAGLNSGFMIVQYVAAALTAENRQLANPASVHNIPTCNGTESIVSMGGWSARKASQAADNAYRVLACELFAACQALDFTKEKTTEKLHHIHHHIRQHVPHIQTDTYTKPYIDIIYNMIKNDEI